MGTSKDILQEEIFELRTQLNYIKENYEEVYDEAVSYYMDLED